MSDPNDPQHDDDQQPTEQPAAILPICGVSMMTGAWAPAEDDDPNDQQPALIISDTRLISDTAIIGGEDRQPAPLPADDLLPSDELKPGTEEE